MTGNPSNARFLLGHDEIFNAIISMCKNMGNSHIYISGPLIKPIADVLMSGVNEIETKPHVFMIVPSIASKDYASSSFLFYVNYLSKRIRINNRAVHNIITCNEEVLLISYITKKMGDHAFSGCLIKDRIEASKATTYCLELWNSSLPLHFDER